MHTINKYSLCPFCDNTAVPHWDTMNLWKCSSCGLFFRKSLPSQEEIKELYEKSWMDPYEHTSETGGTTLTLARVYVRKLVNSLNYDDLRGMKICEFGAGKGTILTALAELGADVYGIEPFGYVYLKKQGFRVFRTLNDIPKELVFDGIISIDVIEHLPSPWYEIKRLGDFLVESGWVYISTLNTKGINAKIFRSKWREIRKAGHLIFFSPYSLEKILTSCGFKRYRRLKWFVKYSRNPVRTLLHYGLQASRLDGELRYLAWRS